MDVVTGMDNERTVVVIVDTGLRIKPSSNGQYALVFKFAGTGISPEQYRQKMTDMVRAGLDEVLAALKPESGPTEVREYQGNFIVTTNDVGVAAIQGLSGVKAVTECGQVLKAEEMKMSLLLSRPKFEACEI
jgi:hypothetical protein